MPRPDVEMVHNEAGHVYYNGLVYSIILMTTGWRLARANEPCIHEAETVEDCCAWLMAQKATI